MLLECMSNLTANEMFQEEGAHERTVEAVMEGVKHLRDSVQHLVIVTNEIFETAQYHRRDRSLSKLSGRDQLSDCRGSR